MRLAFATTFDAKQVRHWSGTPYHMSQEFERQGDQLSYFGPFKRRLPPFFKIKQVYKKWLCQQRESPRFNVYAAQQYSAQLAEALEGHSIDAIVSPLVNPIAYLETDKPLVLWTDALYAGLVGFYAPFSKHAASSIEQGNTITAACLSRCSLAIFSSEWAARTALEIYGISRRKVHVVPFGANLQSAPKQEAIDQMIAARSTQQINLLFFAKSWERKGGDLVLAIAKKLYESGYPVILNILGYQPAHLNPIPPYVRCLGYISKQSAEGQARIYAMLAQTHFLVVPSRAEAFGIVFCEANAFAIPCLSTYVGGISSVIKDGINGMTFSLEASADAYCNYIVQMMQAPDQYQALAQSSYQEYVTRLNWHSSVAQVRSLLTHTLSTGNPDTLSCRSYQASL